MSSIITHVILPGLGPVCPECFSRGHIAAFSLAPGEVYSYAEIQRLVIARELSGRALLARRAEPSWWLRPLAA